jgi:excisionase family DNA binding protein
MIYTIEEVAQVLKVSVATVRRLIRSGRLEASLVGKQYRVSQEDLDKFLSRSKKRSS